MQPLIIISGPTAVGKTALSIKLAKRIGAEIISADSMQVYRGMDIGTAKISTDMMQGIPHHLIDVLDATEAFNIVWFQQMAKACVQDIVSRGKIPLVVGGSAFYIQALLYDIDFGPGSWDGGAYRAKLEALVREHDGAYLHELLMAVDPAAAAKIHENNVKRTIRALEFYKQSGGPISVHNETQRQRPSPFDFRYFVLNDDRQAIYGRIERRVDEMMERGLLDEVRGLKEAGLGCELVSMQGLGYGELLAHLDGEMTLDMAVGLIKRNSRRYAKRQLTWFRRERDVIWLDRRDYADDVAMLDAMVNAIPVTP